jgi:hypothetical protein
MLVDDEQAQRAVVAASGVHAEAAVIAARRHDLLAAAGEVLE